MAKLQGECPGAINVVMLGPPGAGKGTQAERLSRTRKVPKVSTGDILREAVQADTELGRAAKATMHAGNLVGDDMIIAIVQDRLSRSDTHKGFILDGFPRTVIQATALDRMLGNRGPLVVIDIVVPEEVLALRLATRRICSKCGSNASIEWTDACAKCDGELRTRVDDGIEIVRERLKVYHRQTRPLVEFYSSRPNFSSIDGDRAPDVVAAAVNAALDAAIGAAGRGVTL